MRKFNDFFQTKNQAYIDFERSVKSRGKALEARGEITTAGENGIPTAQEPAPLIRRVWDAVVETVDEGNKASAELSTADAVAQLNVGAALSADQIADLGHHGVSVAFNPLKPTK